MKKINLNLRSKVLLLQYGGIFSLSLVGFAWQLHALAGIVLFVYGVFITAMGYKYFKVFLGKKWNKI